MLWWVALQLLIHSVLGSENTRTRSAGIAILGCLAVLAPVLAGAQVPAGKAAPGTPLVVTGSSTMYPLMQDIVRRFEEQHPGVSIEVRSGGSGQGIADLRAGRSDLAMVSRQLERSESDLFTVSLCQDGAAIVVHRTNRLKGLSRRQLADVLTGRIDDWKQLGARAGPIKLAWREEGQGIPELLFRHPKLRPEQIRSATVIFENPTPSRSWRTIATP